MKKIIISITNRGLAAKLSCNSLHSVLQCLWSAGSFLGTQTPRCLKMPHSTRYAVTLSIILSKFRWKVPLRTIDSMSSSELQNTKRLFDHLINCLALLNQGTKTKHTLIKTELKNQHIFHCSINQLFSFEPLLLNYPELLICTWCREYKVCYKNVFIHFCITTIF